MRLHINIKDHKFKFLVGLSGIDNPNKYEENQIVREFIYRKIDEEYLKGRYA